MPSALGTRPPGGETRDAGVEIGLADDAVEYEGGGNVGHSGITCDGIDVGEAESNAGVETDEDVGRNKGVRETEDGCVGGDEGIDDDEDVGAGGQDKFLLVPEFADG